MSRSIYFSAALCRSIYFFFYLHVLQQEAGAVCEGNGLTGVSRRSLLPLSLETVRRAVIHPS